MSLAPRVSVLTPIFNVERYLPECLDSLLGQTLDDIEFICINDGSTDNSLAILKQYAERDDRIVIIDKPNGGYGESMNRGLDLARGEFIGIVESDDFADPEMFRVLYEAASSNECDMVRSNRFNHTDDGDTFIEILRGLPYDTVFRPMDNQAIFNPAPCIWSALYRRQFLIDNGIRFLETPGASFQDTGFVYKSLISAQRIMLLRNAFLHYRIDNSGSSVKSSSKVFNITDEFHSIEEFIHNRPEESDFRATYQALKYQAYQWNYNRLGWKARRQFLEVFSAEFKALKDAGTLQRDAFSLDDWLRLQAMIDDPEGLFEKEAPLVSVIVPAYNCERHLIDTLDSLRNQTLGPIEVLVIDDGSTDGTPSLADDFAKSCPFVAVIHQQNGGVSSARNTGLENASGKYVSFIDGEDIVPPNALEIMYRRCEAMSAELSIGVIHEFNPILSNDFDRTVSLSLKDEIDRYDFDLIWSFSVNNKLFLRKRIEGLGLRFDNAKIAEDGLFLMSYVFNCSGITGAPTTVLEYRRDFFWDGFSATHTANKRFVVDLVSKHEEIIELAAKSIRRDISSSQSEERKRELATFEITYIRELHRRLISFLIDLQYRRIWLLDDESVAILRSKIDEHRAFISDDDWSGMCRWHSDLHLEDGIKTKDELTVAPEVSIALCITQETNPLTVRQLFDSIYHNSMPSFEVLIPSDVSPLVPEFYSEMKNLRPLSVTWGEQFMNAAVDSSRASHIVFMREPVFFNGSTLRDLWREGHNSQADFVVGQIAQIADDHQVLWTSQKTVFTFKRSEGFSKSSRFNAFDCSMNNKLFKVRSIRSRGVSFSDDSRNNAAIAYGELSFKKYPDILFITQMTEEEFLGDRATSARLETTLAYVADRADLDHARRYLEPVQKRVASVYAKVERRIIPKDTILFFSNRDELSDNMRLIYDALADVDCRKLILTEPLPHSDDYNRKVIRALKRSKLVILDDVCQYLRDVQVHRDKTHIVQLWHACGAFKKFGLDNLRVPADLERANHSQYSLVSVSSSHVRDIYARAFGIDVSRVRSLGVPRTDLLLDTGYQRRNKGRVFLAHPELADKRLVLYCPTFRQINGTQSVWSHGLDWASLSRALPDDVVLVVKPHPLERFDLLGGQSYKNVVRLDDVKTSDVLFAASLIITDYSSIVFDAALLGIPALFYCPDLSSYETGFYLDFPDDLYGRLVTDPHDLSSAIVSSLESFDWSHFNQFRERYLGSCDGNSTNRIAKFIRENYL